MVQIKLNTRKLYGAIRLFTALARPICVTETFEKTRDRVENRRVELFVNEANVPKCWKHIERLAKVTRWGTRRGKPYNEVSFYALSQPVDSAQKVARMIRQHWFIENKLHWVKDAILLEDKMTIKQPHMATVVACFNTVVLNVIRMAGFKPTKGFFAKYTNKVKDLINLFEKSG